MKLQKIYLKNYRNYDDILLELNNNLNIIIGDNAQGKTNLLESIYVLAVTKSFLSISDKNLINLTNLNIKVFSSTRWTVFKYSNTITTKKNNIHLRNIIT